MRGWASTARTIACLLVVAVMVPGLAWAHGALRSSNPKSGAHLAVAPRDLRLTFTEPAELAVARIRLVGPDDIAVALSPLRHGDSTTVVVADIAGGLIAGTYTVEWQVAGKDGHPVRGRFRFTIAPGATGLATGVAPALTTGLAASDPAAHAGHDTAAPIARSAPGDSATATPHHDPTAMPSGEGFGVESPAFAAVRWVGYVGMIALVGVVGLGLVVLPAARRRAGLLLVGDAPLRRAGLAAIAVLLVGALLRLLAQSVAMHGRDALDSSLLGSMLANTLWGRAWLLQLGAIVAGVLGFTLLPARRRIGWTLVVGATLACAATFALSGHAAAVSSRRAIAVLSDAVHIVAAGGWVGTLAAVVFVGLRAARRGPAEEHGPAAAALVNAFSPVALLCAGLLTLTGVVSATMHLGSIASLLSSGYGRTLLVKLGVLALVVGIGAYNWLRVRPVLGDAVAARRIRRSSLVELGVAAVVLAVTAVLVATPPDAAHVVTGP